MAVLSNTPLTATVPGSWVTTTTNTTSVSLPQPLMQVNKSGTLEVNGGSWSKHGVVESSLTEQELESEVFKVPVATLVNLWCARFGHEWAALDEVMDDAFFGRAYKRLKQLGELEVHYLTDRARYVCRVPQ